MAESNDKKAVKSGIWYILANFATRGIGFLTMPIFVRLMTQDEIGQFVNFTTWIGLLLPVFTLGLDSSVPVAAFDYKKKTGEYITSMLVLGSAVTVGSYLLNLIFGTTVKGVLKFDSLQLNIMFLYMLTSPALQMLQIKSRLDYKYKLSAVLSLLSVGVSTLSALLAVILFENKLQARILGIYLPTIALNTGIYFYFITRSRTVKKEYWKYGVRISLPLVLHTVAGSALNSFDKIMINSMVGDSETAMYSVAYTCGTVVQMLWYSINQAWAPWAYEQMDKNNVEKLKKASRKYLFLFGLMVLTFLLFAPELLMIIGGSSYSPALNVIPPVMCGFVFLLVYSLYVNIEVREKKTVFVAVGTVIAALFNIGLNYIFIPKYGYIAAAYTTLAGYALLFLMHFFFVYRIRKSFWYDSRFNFLYLLVFAALPAVMPFVYKAAMLRYVIIAAIAVLAALLFHRRKTFLK